MIVTILLGSLIGLALALLVPGYSDLVLLAGPMTIASLFLLVQNWLGQRRLDGDADARPRKKPASKRKHLVIDGSNVLHWNDNQPDIRTVVQAVNQAKGAGFTPGVIFDANVGYKIGNRYLDDADLARLLGLPVDRVLVVPKGVVADQYILKAARDLGARIVTNDRYRDWVADFPEAAKPGFMITGSAHDGVVLLNGI